MTTRMTGGAIVTCAGLSSFTLPRTPSNPITGNFLEIPHYFGTVGTGPISGGLTDENTRTLILGLFSVESRASPERTRTSLVVAAG